jgi:hypothetical protein
VGWHASTRGLNQIWLNLVEKAEKFKNHAIFWEHAHHFVFNMATSRKQIPQNVMTLHHFFLKKCL